MADFNNFIKGFETQKKPEQNVAQQPTQPKPVDPKPVEPNFDEIIFNNFGEGFKKSSYDPHIYEHEDGREYWIGNDEEANQATRDDIKNFIDEEGVENFTPEFKEWIYTNAVDDDFVKKVQQEEMDYYNEEGDKETAEYISKMTPYGFLDYLKENYGEEEVANLVKKNNAIDVNKVVDEAISWDGRGHFLSGYDGEEIELPNGLFAYRRN